jgi:hypothetical protein
MGKLNETCRRTCGGIEEGTSENQIQYWDPARNGGLLVGKPETEGMADGVCRRCGER